MKAQREEVEKRDLFNPALAVDLLSQKLKDALGDRASEQKIVRSPLTEPRSLKELPAPERGVDVVDLIQLLPALREKELGEQALRHASLRLPEAACLSRVLSSLLLQRPSEDPIHLVGKTIVMLQQELKESEIPGSAVKELLPLQQKELLMALPLHAPVKEIRDEEPVPSDPVGQKELRSALILPPLQKIRKKKRPLPEALPLLCDPLQIIQIPLRKGGRLPLRELAVAAEDGYQDRMAKVRGDQRTLRFLFQEGELRGAPDPASEHLLRPEKSEKDLLRDKLHAALLQLRLMQKAPLLIGDSPVAPPLLILKEDDGLREILREKDPSVPDREALLPAKLRLQQDELLHPGVLHKDLTGVEQLRQNPRDPAVHHVRIDHPLIDQGEALIDLPGEKLVDGKALDLPLKALINIGVLLEVPKDIAVKGKLHPLLETTLIGEVEVKLPRKLNFAVRQGIDAVLVEPCEAGAILYRPLINEEGLRVRDIRFDQAAGHLLDSPWVLELLLAQIKAFLSEGSCPGLCSPLSPLCFRSPALPSQRGGKLLQLPLPGISGKGAKIKPCARILQKRSLPEILSPKKLQGELWILLI